MEMALEEKFGQMVVYKNNDFKEVSLKAASGEYNYIDVENNYLVKAARGVGISFGD
jgi:6-phosphofructokinase 1